MSCQRPDAAGEKRELRRVRLRLRLTPVAFALGKTIELQHDANVIKHRLAQLKRVTSSFAKVPRFLSDQFRGLVVPIPSGC